MAKSGSKLNFTNPPLDEVVLGVQFSDIPGYNSMHSRDVWELFRDDFPQVEEKALLEPKFETFGDSLRKQNVRFRVGAPPVGSRLWFVSQEESHLLQFQSNRFVMNWRNRPEPNDYPRYEKISDDFRQYLDKLNNFVREKFGERLVVNQSEIVYVNIIKVSNFSSLGDWLRFWSNYDVDVESMNVNFSEVVKNSDGAPIARFFNEVQSAISEDQGQRAFKFSLTFRGKPLEDNIESAIKFINMGHDFIVTRFQDATTDEAQVQWGRQ